MESNCAACGRYANIIALLPADDEQPVRFLRLCAECWVASKEVDETEVNSAIRKLEA